MMRVDASEATETEPLKRRIARHLQLCAGPAVLIVENLGSSSQPTVELLGTVLEEVTNTGKLVYKTNDKDLVVDVGKVMVLLTTDAGSDIVVKEFVKGNAKVNENVLQAMEEKVR